MWYLTWNKCEQSWRMKKESKKKTIEIELEKKVMKIKIKKHELKMKVSEMETIKSIIEGKGTWWKEQIILSWIWQHWNFKKKTKTTRPCMHIDMKGGQNMKIGGNPKASCFRPIHNTQLLKESFNPLIRWNTIFFHFCKRKW